MAKHFGGSGNSITLIFAGPPGSGKGTYGKILARRWGFSHVSVGDLIRAELNTSSLRGDFKSRADRGLLIPDHLATEICKRWILSNPAQKLWILDGFPRTLRQAEMLREFARPHACVNFQLPRSIVLKKLLGRSICKLCGENFNMAGIHDTPYDMPAILPEQNCEKCNGNAPLFKRADDTMETILKRLDTHEKTTRPVIDQYDAEGILLNFEVLKGIGDMARLEATILSFLHKKYGVEAGLAASW